MLFLKSNLLKVCSFHLGATSWTRATLELVVAGKANVLYPLTLAKKSAALAKSPHPP